MKKVMDAGKWIARNFFSITIALLTVVYLRWFRLTPFMFGTNDPDYAYLVGVILVALYGLLALLSRRAKNHHFLKRFLFFPSAILLLLNIWHVYAFFPSLEITSKCNGNTYYLTWMHPFGDYQWTFDNITIWRPLFGYESFFFGYSGGPYKIVCDEEKNEAHIVDTSREILAQIDGANARSFDRYAGTQLKDHRYFLAWQCNDWSPPTCATETYTLYQCNMDFKSCDPLPLQYMTGNTSGFVFEADETTNEISLYDDFADNPNRTLLFTWGDHPRCYAAGCKILEK